MDKQTTRLGVCCSWYKSSWSSFDERFANADATSPRRIEDGAIENIECGEWSVQHEALQQSRVVWGSPQARPVYLVLKRSRRAISQISGRKHSHNGRTQANRQLLKRISPLAIVRLELWSNSLLAIAEGTFYTNLWRSKASSKVTAILRSRNFVHIHG